jgi:hypothetical protein
MLYDREAILIFFLEIQQFFGSDATAGGIKFQFHTRVKEDVKILIAARAAGTDCKDAILSCGSTGKGQMF